MMRQSLITASLILTVILTMGLAGCGDAAGEASTRAPVMLYITSMNEGDPYQASVFDLLEDEITCEVGVKALDPTPAGTSFYMDVMVKGYEISYYRKDTGKNVPATFTGNTNTICTVNSTSSFSMIICRASQKEMPPLQDLCDPGYDQETGLFEIHTTCRAIVWGDTFAGEEVVSRPAQMTVNFACDWQTAN